MFENLIKFFKKFGKNEKENSKSTAKERLHLVLAQDRANISADFLEMMKQEIIEVIKKYIDIDEEAIDVRMTNKPGEDGTLGAPALYANIPIVTIKNDARKLEGKMDKNQKENNSDDEQKVLKTEESQETKNEENNINSKAEKDNKKQEIDENATNSEQVESEDKEVKTEQQPNEEEENDEKKDS